MTEQQPQQPEKEWDNCPKCGWHYKRVVLETCPMCRYAWRLGKPGYQQPPYEPPTLSP